MTNFFNKLRLLFLILFKLIQKKIRILSTSLLILTLLIFTTLKFEILNLNQDYLSEGFIGTYQTGDLPDPVLKLLSSSLISVDPTGKPKPNLSSSWEVNSDATIFKFKLKDGLKWTDHSPVKTSDLEFNIPDVEVSFPDDKIVQFKLSSPFSPFPTLLTRPIFKKGGSLLGVGPYKLSKIERSRIFITKIILEPVKDKRLPSLSIRFYPNEKTAQTAFALGEINALFGPVDLHPYSSYPQVKIHQSTILSKIVTIFYNTSDKVLSNRSLRQALSFQAPEIKDEIVAETNLSPNSWGYHKPEKDFLGNSDEAKAALSRAKANISEDLLQKEIVLTSTPTLESVGRKVISVWQELGIKATLRVESGIPQNFQALLITQTIPHDPDQYSLWHSTQTKTNISKYDSKRADKDLEDARKTANEEERKEKYSDLQRVLLEDSPATFLYFPKFNIVYLKKAEAKLQKVLPAQI